MADGKTHARASKRTLIIGSVLLAYFVPPPLSLFLMGGLVLGRYADPDARDQAHLTNESEAMMYRDFGLLPGLLWQLYWLPLSANIKHRNWRSHFPVLATFIAWLYMWTPWLTLLYIYDWQWFIWLCTVSILTLPGWIVQDIVHLHLDNYELYWT